MTVPFRRFYQTHKERLFSYLMRMTGDYHLSSDLMQESFTRYLERYGREQDSARLLYTIARNALFDISRKEGRRKSPDPEETSASYDHERTVMVREEYRQVLAAMERLEAGDRDILALVVSSDLSYKEIAETMGISEANVKVKVHRARQNLKKILTQGDS
jgi:RNA polymerase sigma-70 factor (ECF subfamily)